MTYTLDRPRKLLLHAQLVVLRAQTTLAVTTGQSDRGQRVLLSICCVSHDLCRCRELSVNSTNIVHANAMVQQTLPVLLLSSILRHREHPPQCPDTCRKAQQQIRDLAVFAYVKLILQDCSYHVIMLYEA